MIGPWFGPRERHTPRDKPGRNPYHAPMHAVMVDVEVPEVGGALQIGGDEASHALRVKRLETGQCLRVLDGAGVVAIARITGTRKGGRDGLVMDAMVERRDQTPFPGVLPWVEVLSATPKGGRVDEMIDALSQVGAASWSPLDTERGVVDPREHKLARMERIARESAKQCGRAWVLRIGEKQSFDSALASGGEANVAAVIMADAAGDSWSRVEAKLAGGAKLRILIGPEGGWTDAERERARAAGVMMASFGPHVMRIEQAAAAACAVVMAGARRLGEE